MGGAPGPHVVVSVNPSPDQKSVWDSFKAVSQRASAEIRKSSLNLEQLTIVSAYYTGKGMPPPANMAPYISIYHTISKKIDSLHNAISGVELGTLGLRFERGDIDIMAEPGTSSDIVSKYQLSGWPIIVAGIVVGGAIVAYISALRQQNHELGGKISALKDDASSMLCADPASALCAEWTETKETSGYNRRENLIDQTEQTIASLPDTVKKLAIGGGIGIALVVGVAALLLWDKKRKL